MCWNAGIKSSAATGRKACLGRTGPLRSAWTSCLPMPRFPAARAARMARVSVTRPKWSPAFQRSSLTSARMWDLISGPWRSAKRL
ncbi:unnamed protein product [Symbiodinium natans]|uniref:Uncharacterized protein n=1 Tax=Symbiodinium natans TaxID=878477 RepID=A0A812INH6_9DINO|nr:unnamed protein product [Symbiodinium natans]